jgi:hypothetical protein
MVDLHYFGAKINKKDKSIQPILMDRGQKVALFLIQKTA